MASSSSASTALERVRDTKRLHQEVWMREREISIQRRDVEAQIKFDHQPPSDTIILDQVTERITRKIEEKLKMDLLKSQVHSVSERERKDVITRLEDFLSSELHTYICQICYELMSPPDRPPILLFPCGHTFCSHCLAQNRKNNKCPYCREPIKSKAENRCLKYLIERFVAERQKLERGEISDSDQLFSACRLDDGDGEGVSKGMARRSSSSGSSRYADKGNNRKLSQRFGADFQSRVMRHGILQNELVDSQEQLAALSQRRKGALTTRRMLEKEKQQVALEIARLQEQAVLVEHYLAGQVEKERRLEQEECNMKARVTLIEKTVQTLQGEVEKYRVLAEGLRDKGRGGSD